MFFVGILNVSAFVVVSKTSQVAPKPITAKVATELVKTSYPELAGYPSDSLPPKTITYKKSLDGWYLAFIQLGSGRPILSASCFFVSNYKIVQPNGTYVPVSSSGQTEKMTISPVTCK